MGKQVPVNGANRSLGCEIRFEIRTKNWSMLYRLREEGGVLRDYVKKNIRVKGLPLPSPLLAKEARNGAPPSDAIPSEKRVWVGDPTDAQYLETKPAHLLEVAGRLVAGDGLVRIEGEQAEATAGLMGQAERFESAMRAAVEELEKKHAFERG